MIIFFAALYLLIQPVGAEEFLYKHQEGDKYRILSTVQEDVYINNMLIRRVEILNRISAEVISVSEGKGRHRAVFQTSERIIEDTPMAGMSYRWAREYSSEFERDRLGRLTIDREYIMPVVRDVPVFPGRDLQPGDKWSEAGEEVHDFREIGIKDPYRIPFIANYTFLGDREWKGKMYPAFSVNYEIRSTPAAIRGSVYPRRIIAKSNQIVYWDSNLGQPFAYTETFQHRLEFSNGVIFEFKGEAEAEIKESERMDKERIAEEIAETIESLNIQDVSVRVADEGIIISLDDIQFQANTTVMLPGEKEKLDKIVGILLNYRERDILVGGHTALADTEEARQKLSVERASVIAEYIIGQGGRTPDRVVVRGYGSERPIADNRTEEGMRKNRRVEITILEN